MFTGIIQCTGAIAAVDERGGDRRISIRSEQLGLDEVALGDSIAVNGVCLTVVTLEGDVFAADVSGETLSLTTVGAWTAGSRVNLEKSLTLATPLGGHIVSGHVDGIGTVRAREADARSTRFEIALPPNLVRYVARKGSIAVDGISLTVNEVTADAFAVNIVPHTLQQTMMDCYAAGTRVNIEVDMIARYVEQLTKESS